MQNTRWLTELFNEIRPRAVVPFIHPNNSTRFLFSAFSFVSGLGSASGANHFGVLLNAPTEHWPPLPHASSPSLG